MELRDFKIGQKVCLYVIAGSNKRRTMMTYDHDRVFVEGTVEKVGRKYVEVSIGMSYGIKFDSTNNFLQETKWSRDYALFLTREDAEREENRGKEICKLRDNVDRYGKKLSYEDLAAVNAIFEKYAK